MSVRIAYVISTLDRCGPVNVLHDIARRLAPDHELAAFTLAAEPAGSRAADFEALGVPVRRAVAGRLASALVGESRLARALARFEPDVVHAHGFRAYRLCRSLPRPTIATVHNELYDDFATAYGRLPALWMTRSEVRALRRFDLVVACSRSGARVLAEKYALACECIRNGIDQDLYAPASEDRRARLRAELGYDAGATILVSTGGCSRRKGTPALIRAFAAANAAGRAQLHILGAGPLYAACRSLGAPGVVLHGFVDDVVPHLQAADLFVSASRSEGMPLAVLEALSCGLPALLSAIAPHEEVAGILADQGCVECFDAADEGTIRRALGAALGGAAPARPADASALSSDVMARRYADAYRALARRGGGS